MMPISRKQEGWASVHRMHEDYQTRPFLTMLISHKFVSCLCVHKKGSKLLFAPLYVEFRETWRCLRRQSAGRSIMLTFESAPLFDLRVYYRVNLQPKDVESRVPFCINWLGFMEEAFTHVLSGHDTHEIYFLRTRLSFSLIFLAIPYWYIFFFVISTDATAYLILFDIFSRFLARQIFSYGFFLNMNLCFSLFFFWLF